MLTPQASLIAALTLLACSTAMAQGDATAVPAEHSLTSAALTLQIDSKGDIERRIVTYLCDTDQSVRVQYLNAAPNFLAIVPVEGESIIFASALSASGARYVAGPYEWWSHQGEATLRDLMQDEDAAPLLTCTESSNTP